MNFFYKTQGRPHGGILWLIANKLKIKDFIILSKQISKLTSELNFSNTLAIYGIWFGFDDNKNRIGSLSAFKNIHFPARGSVKK